MYLLYIITHAHTDPGKTCVCVCARDHVSSQLINRTTPVYNIMKKQRSLLFFASSIPVFSRFLVLFSRPSINNILANFLRHPSTCTRRVYNTYYIHVLISVPSSSSIVSYYEPFTSWLYCCCHYYYYDGVFFFRLKTRYTTIVFRRNNWLFIFNNLLSVVRARCESCFRVYTTKREIGFN